MSEGGHQEGDLNEHEIKAYYGRVVGEGNAVVGLRSDTETDEHRHWLLTGYEFETAQGIAVATSLFFGESGRIGARLEMEKEFSLAEKIALVPEMTVNAHSKDDPQTGTGSGLSDAEVAVRLFYQVTPAFAPYVGAVWGKTYGDTADYVRADGDSTEGSVVMLGFSYSF